MFAFDFAFIFFAAFGVVVAFRIRHPAGRHKPSNYGATAYKKTRSRKYEPAAIATHVNSLSCVR